MRIALLVLSVNSGTLYPRFKKIWKLYDYRHPQIDTFYLYGRVEDQMVKGPQDLVYDDIPEQHSIHEGSHVFQNMLRKTLRGYKHVLDLGCYDYVIRTNLSTFWNLDKAYQRVLNLPREQVFRGSFRTFHRLPRPKAYFTGTYVSGTDQLISIDLVKKIVDDQETVISQNLTEDWAVSEYIRTVLGVKPILDPSQFRVEHLKTAFELYKYKPKIPIEGYDHYRIKNVHNRELDIELAKHLYSLIYG